VIAPVRLNVSKTDDDFRMFYNEIIITIRVANKNYNYSKYCDIFNIFDHISVYADHAMDKQISSAC